MSERRPDRVGEPPMNSITVFLTIACLAVGVVLGAAGYLYLGVPVVILAIVIASALKMANTWEKFVILRAGKLRGVKGPGLFLIIPVTTTSWPLSMNAFRPRPSAPKRR